MPADDTQVGGQHYKSGYQHWNFVIKTGIGYLEGNATKYLTRWRNAGKPESDLLKAQHYTQKLRESAPYQYYPKSRMPQRMLRIELTNFCTANGISGLELEAIVALTTWEVPSELKAAGESIDALLKEFQVTKQQPDPAPVPLEDSNKHAERSVP